MGWEGEGNSRTSTAAEKERTTAGASRRKGAEQKK